jgi:hypothetical protein
MCSNIMKIPENTTKFLVMSSDRNYLSYLFGQYGIYVGKIQPIMSGSKLGAPTIATIRYNDGMDIGIASMDLNEADFYCQRVFKSEMTKIERKDRIDKFLGYCAKNLVYLVPNMTIKISSNNIDLRSRFYRMAFDANITEGTRCHFDYDDFDIEFTIKEYVSGDKYWIVTFIEGLE